MTEIVPIIMAGGKGTRLWPVSRESYPKQFSKFIDDLSLFQKSVLRFQTSNGMNFSRPIVITNAKYRFIVVEQLHEISVDPLDIILEPVAKDTAPAILAASLRAKFRRPNSAVIVVPSDHEITDNIKFHETIANGLAALSHAEIVTFGVTPTEPSVSYGYIETRKSLRKKGAKVIRFVEKPPEDRAKEFYLGGNYLWNSGIFLFLVNNMIEIFQEMKPEMLNLVSESIEKSVNDMGFLRLHEKPWETVEKISVDHAILERSEKTYVVPFLGDWTDLGDWDAVSQTAGSKLTTQASENTVKIDCNNSLIWSDDAGKAVVGVGLTDLIVIAMKDAVLVVNRNETHRIKEAVERLKAYNLESADSFPVDHRPWGWFERLALGSRFQVKRIHVKPGGSLSLQSHYHRAEHWVVVQGTAVVNIDDEEKVISENQSIYIPLGAKHRLSNRGKIPIELIEVQTGTYLKEDDIVRFSDEYSRI